ncbi:MAG: hypothetical protein M3N98_14935 [Actinomycetota bacterium]|nr:hypothetical protein [Actinomycetota bacterium]
MMESVVPEDYEALCRDWTDPTSVAGWLLLNYALGGRVGWWFMDPRLYQDYEGGPVWCFGEATDPQLSLVAVADRFELYVADTDEEVAFDAIGDVVAWLDEYEREYEGISPGLNELLQGRGQGRAEWRSGG